MTKLSEICIVVLALSMALVCHARPLSQIDKTQLNDFVRPLKRVTQLSFNGQTVGVTKWTTSGPASTWTVVLATVPDPTTVKLFDYRLSLVGEGSTCNMEEEDTCEADAVCLWCKNATHFACTFRSTPLADHTCETREEKAFKVGVTDGANATEADKPLKDDLLQPFNPWRVVTVDRPLDKPFAKPPQAYIESFSGTGKYWESLPDSFFTRSGTKDAEAENTPVRSLFCKFALEKEDGEHSHKWTSSGKVDMNGFASCSSIGLETQPLLQYYSGLIKGWLNKPEHAKIKEIYGKLPMQADISLSRDVKPGYRARGGGWHIDGTYTGGTTGSCAPLYFVVVDKHPTLFFAGKLGDFLSDADKDDLKRHKCAEDVHPGKDCKGKNFVDQLFGDTYQIFKPHSDFPLEKNLGGKVLYGDVKDLQNEPFPQYMDGVFNAKVMDACGRAWEPFYAQSCFTSLLHEDDADQKTTLEAKCHYNDATHEVTWTTSKVTQTCLDIYKKASWKTSEGTNQARASECTECDAEVTGVADAQTCTTKTLKWQYGPTDNPKGANYRKAAKALLEEHYLGKQKPDPVQPAGEGYELAPMGPYRIHLAGMNPKDNDKTDKRFFIRFLFQPQGCMMNPPHEEQVGERFRSMRKGLNALERVRRHRIQEEVCMNQEVGWDVSDDLHLKPEMPTKPITKECIAEELEEVSHHID